MGICMTKDTTKPQTTRNHHTELQAMYQADPTENTLPSELDPSSENASSRVFVIDTAIMKHLPDALNSPMHKHMAPEFLKRVPFVIQRTIRESDIYEVPNLNIIFVFDTEEQKSEILSNLKRLTDISGRLHHIDMLATFLEVASVIGSQDSNIIPPAKALEVFINRISSEKENVDALLVTGYPRNMRDVVEYMTRVQRISGVILLLDPKYESYGNDDSGTDLIDTRQSQPDSGTPNNFRSNIYPIIEFFKQDNLLHTVTLERPLLDVFHDVYDKVLLILSRLPQTPSDEVSDEDEVTETAKAPSAEIASQSGICSVSAGRIRSTTALNLKEQVINKDIQDVLSLVRAGSIMGRISSAAQSKLK
ncbi:uncharacterized protein LOC130697767 isoform X2 [Daphnia carinata]|uniref:uncharacterized protein LOC130697767 isoform X2 n=1 Tax=Daphnia carinata TaxID=120202 RepID=UPI002580AD95|nr:uncharacterized protein LOC130697767 isoform X2 [Daphnia carinata]